MARLCLALYRRRLSVSSWPHGGSKGSWTFPYRQIYFIYVLEPCILVSTHAPPKGVGYGYEGPRSKSTNGCDEWSAVTIIEGSFSAETIAQLVVVTLRHHQFKPAT